MLVECIRDTTTFHQTQVNPVVEQITQDHHHLCICNLIVLIANQIQLQKFDSLIGTQLVVSNIRPFSRVHSPKAQCEESVLSGYSKVARPSFL